MQHMGRAGLGKRSGLPGSLSNSEPQPGSLTPSCPARLMPAFLGENSPPPCPAPCGVISACGCQSSSLPGTAR